MNRQKIYDLTGGRCFYCGCDLDFENFHIDHFIPKNKGGKNKDNCVPSCPDCNNMKCDLTIDEFKEKIANLLNLNIYGRMIKKYYAVKEIEPYEFKFFYEGKWGVTGNGDL